MANYGGQGWQRRKAILAAKGYTDAQWRRLSKAEKVAATKRATERGVYKTKAAGEQAAEQIAPPVRRLIQMGGGRELLSSMRNAELYAFLTRAESRDLRVWAIVTRSIRVREAITPENPEGFVPYDEVQLWRRGGIDPSYILDDLRAARSRDVVGWLRQYLRLPDRGPAAKNTLGRSPKLLLPPAQLPRGRRRRPNPIITGIQLNSGTASGAAGVAS